MPNLEHSDVCPACGALALDGVKQPSPYSMKGTVRYHPACWDKQVATTRAAIELGERDIAAGRVVEHAEVMELLKRFETGLKPSKCGHYREFWHLKRNGECVACIADDRDRLRESLKRLAPEYVEPHKPFTDFALTTCSHFSAGRGISIDLECVECVFVDLDNFSKALLQASDCPDQAQTIAAAALEAASSTSRGGPT